MTNVGLDTGFQPRGSRDSGQTLLSVNLTRWIFPRAVEHDNPQWGWQTTCPAWSPQTNRRCLYINCASLRGKLPCLRGSRSASSGFRCHGGGSPPRGHQDLPWTNMSAEGGPQPIPPCRCDCSYPPRGERETGPRKPGIQSLVNVLPQLWVSGSIPWSNLLARANSSAGPWPATRTPGSHC